MGDNKMTGQEFHPYYEDCYEYHGNTVVEFIRKLSGTIIKRDWILFDSVDEAQDFFNETRMDDKPIAVH